MYSLTQGARRSVARKVQLIWITRKALLPLSIMLLITVEAGLISLPNVFNGAWGAMSSTENFWAFWRAAIINTEIPVLVVSALILICGAMFVRNVVAAGASNIHSLIRRGT